MLLHNAQNNCGKLAADTKKKLNAQSFEFIYPINSDKQNFNKKFMETPGSFE
jgi:hypothetical protein